MKVSLTTEESAALRKALRSYLSDLRSEIVDTDNAQYKRELKEERELLEAAVSKLDETVPADASTRSPDQPTVRVVEMWWATGDL
jgi:hypothetical protein